VVKAARTVFKATFKPETTDKWVKMVKEWEQYDTKPNPYVELVNSTVSIFLPLPSTTYITY